MTLKTMSRPDMVRYLVESLGPQVRDAGDQLAGAALRMAEIVHLNSAAAVVGLQLLHARMRPAGFHLPGHARTYLLDAASLTDVGPNRPALDEADLISGVVPRVDFLGRLCATPEMLERTAALLLTDACCAAAAGLLIAPQTWLQAMVQRWIGLPRLVYAGPLLSGGEQALGCVYVSGSRLGVQG